MCTSHTTSRLPFRRSAAWSLLIAACLGCTTLPPSSSTALSLDDLSWIDGCWTMTTSRGSTITERWTRASADTLAGTSRTVRNGAIVASETLHIFMRGDTAIYAALPSGQAYTEFRARGVEGRTVVFENPGHDYPQRVIYRAAPDSLYARIEGTVSGVARTSDFPMRRADCAP